jgi:glycosyltransferase involved in cell wall biosynthesis
MKTVASRRHLQKLEKGLYHLEGDDVVFDEDLRVMGKVSDFVESVPYPSQNLHAPIKYVGNVGVTGYAKACRNLTRSLREVGIDYIFEVHHGHPIVDDLPNCERISSSEEYHTIIIHAVPTYLVKERIEREKEANKRTILITVWETLKIPQQWNECLAAADLVLTPNTWNLSAFEEVCCAQYLPHPVAGCLLPPSQGKYRFYSINEWTGRKNLDLLVRAFCEEFVEDNVELYLKTSSFSEADKNNLPSNPRITIDTRVLSEEEIENIHRDGCCYVSLASSEGLGYGCCEAAMAGRIVISTSFGAQVEYLKGAMFVGTTLTPAKYCVKTTTAHRRCGKTCLVNPLYNSEELWGTPDIFDVRRTMRYVYSKDIRHSETARDYLEASFGYVAIGDRLKKILEM